MSNRTNIEFDRQISLCRNLFEKKMRDYGTAWRILRTSSLTDQIFIKASRIRSIEEKGEARVNEGVIPEFIGMVNYSIMALIQLELHPAEDPHMNENVTLQLFDKFAHNAHALMKDKNHDYGEAWRQMRISSLTDIILMKLLRIKQIEDNEGKTLVSEGLDANYFDIINYSVFALIRLHEKE